MLGWLLAASCGSGPPSVAVPSERACDDALAWRELWTDRVAYCDPPGAPLSDEEVRQNEAALANFERFFGVTVDHRVTYYRYADRAQLRAVRDHDGNGFARGLEVHTIWPVERHELAHVVAGRLGRDVPLLEEGAAVYLSGAWHGRPVDDFVRGYGARGRLPPLASLAEGPAFRVEDDLVTYPVAGSFVKWLVERRGRDRFLFLYGTADRGSMAERLVVAYDADLDALERQWLADLEVRPDADLTDGLAERLRTLVRGVSGCPAVVVDLDVTVTATGSVDLGLRPDDPCVRDQVTRMRFEPPGAEVQLPRVRLDLRRSAPIEPEARAHTE